MNHIKIKQTSQLMYDVELDGQRVGARHIKVEMGLYDTPTVEMELICKSDLELNAPVILDDLTVLRNIEHKLDDVKFQGKLVSLLEKHSLQKLGDIT